KLLVIAIVFFTGGMLIRSSFTSHKQQTNR
ncbi:TPA: sodium:solute symporter, partial [Streptococcus pyogenes]|nr:sodium:solute symporter [Streptococcus pyogenes]